MRYYMFNGLSKEGDKPKLDKKKKITLIVIILCLILVITLVALYITNEKCRQIFDKYIFRKEVNSENLPEIEAESLNTSDIFSYGRYIAVLRQNVLTLYNKFANKEADLDIEISTPLFESNGNYLCVAEKNGQNIYLISNKSIVWQKEIEGNISSINVNKNGYVSVVVSGTSYKAVVETYDSNGNGLFKKYLSETSVIDTDISNDNRYLAIAEADFSGILVQSNIEIISIQDAKEDSSESIKYTYKADADNLIINIKYNNRNELVCMYDKHIDIFKEGQNTELVNFNNEKVLFADVDLTSKLVKITEKNSGMFNSEIEMQIINSTNTQNINTYKIESNPKQLYIADDMIAVNLGTSALFIDSNGWLVKKYASSDEIQKIVLCNNIAGVVCKGKIKVVSL